MPDSSQTILVVESNGSLAAMIRTGLEKAGFAVEVSEDGRGAWEKLRSSDFSAVVTDYSMRDSVGTEICRGLRYDKKYASVPVIVTAAAGDVDLASLSDELNLAGALKKPLSVRALVAQVQGVLSSETGDSSTAPAEEAPDPPTPDPPAE